MTTFHRAVEGFSFDLAGVPTVVRGGEILTADDPRYVGHEGYFEPAEAAANRTSEVTTAGPGDTRTLSNPGPALRRRTARPE